MFHILGFIIFIFLIILTIGFFILWRIVNTFLGIGKRMGGTNPNAQNQQRKTYQEAESASQWDSSSSKQTDKKKLFDDDEGEYVEFEEIKD